MQYLANHPQLQYSCAFSMFRETACIPREASMPQALRDKTFQDRAPQDRTHQDRTFRGHGPAGGGRAPLSVRAALSFWTALSLTGWALISLVFVLV
jgi:hypothetical protein